MNQLEPEQFLERQLKGKGYLKRHYHHIPDSITEYEVEEQPTSVSFNVQDCRSVFYNQRDDSLYMSMTRCNCVTCLTDSFINCKVSKHHIHKYSMAKIHSARTYPTPSQANYEPLTSQNLNKNQKSSADSNQKRSNVRETSKAKKASQIPSNQEDNSNINIPQAERSSSIWSRIREDMKKFQKSVVFKMHERPQTSRKILCNISELEKKEVKKRWKSFAITFPYEVMAFKPNNEYQLSAVSKIIQRLRSTDYSHGPAMVLPSISSEDSVELMNPETFLSLIRIYLAKPLQDFTEFMNRAKEELLERFLPRPNFSRLVIVLFSTTGMKKKFVKGEFAYDSSAGHFITLVLNMASSSLTIYDTLNENFQLSAYFDYPLVLRMIDYLYCYHKNERKEPREKLKVYQQKLQRQNSVDCGCHALINLELLMKNKNPADQSFNNALIDDVRKYHFLLNESSINELRVDLS